MELEKILDKLNSFEKNSFLKVIDNIISDYPQNLKDIEKILDESDKDLKNVDNLNISKVFSLIENEFAQYILNEFNNAGSQLDIITDILIRDGNNIMSREWFNVLYEGELKKIKKKTKDFNKNIINAEQSDGDHRSRDYLIYLNCLKTAFINDLENNQECKITSDEQSILLTLSKQLELSQEEIKLINYSILPLEKIEVDKIINELKNKGFIFYSRKSNDVFIADEVVRILRQIRGKEVADKFYRRVLRHIKDSQINIICRKHNIDWKSDKTQKIKSIINEGISFSDVLKNDMFKENISITERKNFLNNLIEKELHITDKIKGSTLDEKINNLITYFEGIEKDSRVGISIDGYEKLLIDLNEFIPELSSLVKGEFELQEDNPLNSKYLLDYNIKPRDVLDIIDEKILLEFCKSKGAKIRGNLVVNVLGAYKDSENIYLENFEKFGYRNYIGLKEHGINLKEAELGIKFENLTKLVFKKLGFNVDEKLKKSLNTNKNKIDIVINLGNNDLIILECKSHKSGAYSKFSSVSRQIKSYIDLAKKNDYNVIKSLLIAPEFSDDFINECELEYELNLSLITASSLIKILKAFGESKHKALPHNLLMRDVLIKEERIIKAISK